VTGSAAAETRARTGTLASGAILAAAGGFLDGLTYVGHGHVFANAMTGNVILLGIEGFEGSWSARRRSQKTPRTFWNFVNCQQLPAAKRESWSRAT